MKLIAHRGNLNGPNLGSENHPYHIEDCIDKGYDVEIDVRYDPKTERLWLGHDTPDYPVTWWWLAGRADHLWIHCKDITTLHQFSNATNGYNYFWHETDKYTLTSKNYIWTFPGRPFCRKSVIVMPEWSDYDWDLLRATNCYGICTDYVEKLA